MELMAVPAVVRTRLRNVGEGGPAAGVPLGDWLLLDSGVLE